MYTVHLVEFSSARRTRHEDYLLCQIIKTLSLLLLTRFLVSRSSSRRRLVVK